jgi:hypothetical protein
MSMREEEGLTAPKRAPSLVAVNRKIKNSLLFSTRWTTVLAVSLMLDRPSLTRQS